MRRVAASALASLFFLSLGAAPSSPSTCSTIAYQRDDRIVHVPVRVNGALLWFDIDSGARHTVIDLTTAKRLHLRFLRTDTSTGAGKGSALRLHAEPLTVSAGGAELRVSDPWVIDLSHAGLSRHVDGLIGFDFFHAYIIQIDPVSQTVAFCDPRIALRMRGTVVPLIVDDDRLFVHMKLTLPNGSTATHRVRIDTGSDDAVGDNLVRRSPTRRKSVQGVGIGKSYIDYSGLFSSVQLGPYVIRNVWGPSDDRPAVGMEVLRRFILTFDVPHSRLVLEPTAHLDDPVPSPPP